MAQIMWGLYNNNIISPYDPAPGDLNLQFQLCLFMNYSLEINW